MGFRGCCAAAAAVAFAFASAGVPASAAADWPIYGHDLANSRTAGDAGPPPSDVPSLSRAWTFNASTGDFTGTPVVADGVLVAGNHGGWVYAIDAITGKELWSKDLGGPINGTAAIDLDAPGGATAYVPVAKIGGPRLVALSLADGAARWDTVLTPQPDASVFGSPVYWNGTVYIGTSGPNNDDSKARGSVVALDEATGAIKWQTFTVPPDRDGAAVWSTPAIDPATGRLYVGTGNNYHPPTTDLEDSILALDAESGAIVGHYQATPDDSFTATDNPGGGPDYDFGASPNLFDGPNGEQLVGEGQKSGVYWALDRATMQPVWHTTVGPGGYLGGILGSTAYDGTRIYAGDTLDGQVSALGKDGTVSWQSADAGGLHVGAVTVANGVLYTTEPNGAVNARDPATGSILTKLPLDGPTLGGVSATGGAIYVAVGTGPPPEPAPQTFGPGSIVAFGDTSTAGGSQRPASGSDKTGRRLRLRVRPRHVRLDRRVRLRFLVTRGTRRIARARISVGRRHVRTGANGRARMRIRFRRPGVHVARASRPGVPGARARIRVMGS